MTNRTNQKTGEQAGRYRKTLTTLAVAAVASAVAFSVPAFAQDSIIVQSTTSTANSGLYEHLLPMIEKDTGVKVNVVAVGTGQAIKNAQNCDGDVLLVHAKPAEEKFVENGYGVKRSDVMYNDFILVGPPNDPAGIAGTGDVVAGLKTIAEAEVLFASRGDNSGTHKAEMRLWKMAGTDPKPGSGKWYRETGSGMGATLNAAVGMGAYAMTDRGTWIAFKNKGDYNIAVQGDDRLFNQYGIILVNPEKCPSVKTAAGQKFIDWILSDKGQKAIASYKMNGEQLFFPNANRGQG